MNNWKVIFATMVIFGAGVVTGGLLVRQSDRLSAPVVRAPLSGRPGQVLGVPGNVGIMRVEFLRRAQRELDLTPEQRERVDRILKESQERTRKLMEPVSPPLREELQRTKQEFRSVLTPEQARRFDEMLAQQQRQQRLREPKMPPRERTGEHPSAR